MLILRFLAQSSYFFRFDSQNPTRMTETIAMARHSENTHNITYFYKIKHLTVKSRLQCPKLLTIQPF